MTTSVTDRFHIVGSSSPRPDAEHVIYADGAGAGALRADDVELSHWVPEPDRRRVQGRHLHRDLPALRGEPVAA